MMMERYKGYWITGSAVPVEQNQRNVADGASFF